MLGLGWSEILLCALVFVLVVPAGQWPEYGVKMGKWLRELKELFGGLQKELQAPFQELQTVKSELGTNFDFTTHNAQIMQQYPSQHAVSAQPPALFNDLSQMQPLITHPANPVGFHLAAGHLDNPRPDNPIVHHEFPPVPDAPGWQRPDKPPAGAVPPPP